MKAKIKGVVLDWSTLGKVDFLEELSEQIDWTFFEYTESHQTAERIKNTEVVLTNKVELNAQNLTGSAVQYIGVLATGTNCIDWDYCHQNHLEVKNAVGYSTDSVAQHTFSFLLQAIAKISFQDQYVKESYGKSPVFTHYGHEYYQIKGKKWGIIGLGNIGKRVAEIATVFGAEVSYYSTSDQKRSDQYPRVSLAELLSTSDFVTIHSPLNDQTLNLIGQKELGQMKSSAILINVGRGGIIHENDLIQALNEGQITTACLDVFEEEPFDFKTKYSALEHPDRLIASPHVAWASREARQALLDITAQNLSLWLNKRNS